MRAKITDPGLPKGREWEVFGRGREAPHVARAAGGDEIGIPGPDFSLTHEWAPLLLPSATSQLS